MQKNLINLTIVLQNLLYQNEGPNLPVNVGVRYRGGKVWFRTRISASAAWARLPEFLSGVTYFRTFEALTVVSLSRGPHRLPAIRRSFSPLVMLLTPDQTRQA